MMSVLVEIWSYASVAIAIGAAALLPLCGICAIIAAARGNE